MGLPISQNYLVGIGLGTHTHADHTQLTSLRAHGGAAVVTCVVLLHVGHGLGGEKAGDFVPPGWTRTLWAVTYGLEKKQGEDDGDRRKWRR